MKIGDKVRFLSEVGGGVASGFQGKDTVMVQDEDGFDIPMLRSQVVVIDTDDYNISKVHTIEPPTVTGKSAGTAGGKKTGAAWEDADVEPADRPVSFKAKPTERKGGDLLNVYLSFVPQNVKEMNTTAFEAYIVNDSNYYVQVLYLNASEGGWRSRFCAVIEPNTKEFVEEFDRTILNDLERVCIQTMAWRQDKEFQLKPAISTELRLDVTKFYKLHAFQPNEFFRDPNWTVPVVRDDKPVRTRFVDAEQIQEALLPKKPSTKA